MKSYRYVDEDEFYFTTSLKQIALIRDRVVFLADLLNSISGLGKPGKELNLNWSSRMRAIYTLFSAGLLTPQEAFRLIKNNYLKGADETVEIIPLSISSPVDQILHEEDEDITRIHQGETDTVEFKSSWRYSLDAKRADPRLSFEIMKTISAFMNTGGGRVYIGIGNDGTVLGLDSTDFLILKKGSLNSMIDQLKLSIDEMFDQMIGSDKIPLRIIINRYIENKPVLIMEIKSSTKPVYITHEGSEHFCVRSSASTRSLSPSQTHSYIMNHPAFGYTDSGEQ